MASVREGASVASAFIMSLLIISVMVFLGYYITSAIGTNSNAPGVAAAKAMIESASSAVARYFSSGSVAVALVLIVAAIAFLIGYFKEQGLSLEFSAVIELPLRVRMWIRVRPLTYESELRENVNAFTSLFLIIIISAIASAVIIYGLGAATTTADNETQAKINETFSQFASAFGTITNGVAMAAIITLLVTVVVIIISKFGIRLNVGGGGGGGGRGPMVPGV